MGLSAALAGVITGPVLDRLGYGALSLGAIALLVPMTALVLRATLHPTPRRTGLAGGPHSRLTRERILR